jgi:hypothetical protein
MNPINSRVNLLEAAISTMQVSYKLFFTRNECFLQMLLV